MLKLAIVEDELFMRDFLENCVDYGELNLEICGSFSCAKDALDGLKEIKPDLIITDIKMPGMDGIEFMSEMLKINENTHFIVISNYLDFETVRNAFQIGICDYIPKIKFNLTSYRNILILLSKIAASEQIEFMNTEEIKEFIDASTSENAYKYLSLKLRQFSEYKTSDNNKLEQQIDEYIKIHYMEDISLKQVAQHFKYEYTYFSKVFRNIKGIAFNKYLNNIRLEEAEKLIRSTNLKYYTIALKVGYQNYEHFNRCFHEKYGCSPNELKRMDTNA